MTGYSVYLQKLLDSAQAMRLASDDMLDVMTIANGPARQAAEALGILGAAADFPNKYNAACSLVMSRAQEASNSFYDAATQLIQTEKDYAAKDATYAKMFGIMDDGTRPTVPDITNRGGEVSKSATLPKSK